MSQHVFDCPNGDHIIRDLSEQPLEAHVQGTERIFCPECNHDVDGVYLGQANGYVESGVSRTSVDLIDARETPGEPYCLHCDGACKQKGETR